MLSRKYKDKEYFKYILVIPEEYIKRAKFKEGDDLSLESKEKEIRIRKL